MGLLAVPGAVVDGDGSAQLSREFWRTCRLDSHAHRGRTPISIAVMIIISALVAAAVWRLAPLTASEPGAQLPVSGSAGGMRSLWTGVSGPDARAAFAVGWTRHPGNGECAYIAPAADDRGHRTSVVVGNPVPQR